MEVDIFSMLELAGILGTAIATIALCFLIWRTVIQLQATVDVSKIQTNYRFRPWVGPEGLKANGAKGDKQKFDLTVRNYGEVPATNVIVTFALDTKLLGRQDIRSKKLHDFDLGPLLPGMEKHYWFYIDSDLIDKARNGQETIFIGIYLDYPLADKRSGYGMISEFVPETSNFVHREMWIDMQSD